MKITNKLLTNLLKIMKINGFHIIVGGESPTTFNVEGSFYFDNNEELETFRNDLKSLFLNHCGGDITVETFHERDNRLAKQWVSQK
jgi:hypothetical protein